MSIASEEQIDAIFEAVQTENIDLLQTLVSDVILPKQEYDRLIDDLNTEIYYVNRYNKIYDIHPQLVKEKKRAWKVYEPYIGEVKPALYGTRKDPRPYRQMLALIQSTNPTPVAPKRGWFGWKSSIVPVRIGGKSRKRTTKRKTRKNK